MPRLALLIVLLPLALAACDGGDRLPPVGGPPVDRTALVFEGASYRATANRPLASLSSSDLEELGHGETEEGTVDMFQLRSDGKEWEVLARSGGSWVTWEPLALDEARRSLSRRLGAPEAQVSIREVERVEWPNACLGAGGNEEICAEVITPGFRIVLEARGQEHVYHSDLQGKVRRAADEE
jgi:hypothetical protein